MPIHHVDQLPQEKDKSPPAVKRLDGKAPHAYILETQGKRYMKCTLCNRKLDRRAAKFTRNTRIFWSTADETAGKARNITDVAIMQHIKNFHSFPILITRQDNSRMLIINQEGEIIPRVIRIEIEGQDNLLETLAEMEKERREFAEIANANQIGPHISESEDPVDAYTETAEDTNALDCVPSAWCYQDESGNQPVEPTYQNLCQREKSECTETLQIGNTFNCSRWPKEKSELYKQYGNSGIVPTPQMRRK